MLIILLVIPHQPQLMFNSPHSGVINKPLKMGGRLRDNGVSEWDDKFVDLPEVLLPLLRLYIHNHFQKELFDVMLAANFMDIKPLLELCCASVIMPSDRVTSLHPAVP